MLDLCFRLPFKAVGCWLLAVGCWLPNVRNGFSLPNVRNGFRPWLLALGLGGVLIICFIQERRFGNPLSDFVYSRQITTDAKAMRTYKNYRHDRQCVLL